jgi:hypothetical protein
MKTINILVRPNGETILETRGYSGEQCQHASRFLEQALGRTVNEQRTAEFYESTVEHVSEHATQQAGG